MGHAGTAFVAGDPPDALLRAIVDQIRDFVALTDTIGTLTWANARFAEATGFVAGSLAHSLLAFAPAGPSGTQTRLALAAMLAEPAREARDLALCGRDGTELWVDARAQALGSSLLWTFADVTAAHQMAQRARRQGELLETAQEFGRLGVWERDIPSGEGRWDDAVFGFWGLDPKDGTPHHRQAIERIHPEDRARMIYAESTRRAGRYSQRYRVVHPDGKTRWMHSQWEVRNGRHGVPDRALGIMMDDTESYDQARALVGANTQLQMAAGLAKISVWRHDLRSDRVFCSEGGFELLGMPPRPQGQLLAEVRSYIHPDDIAGVVASAERALGSDQPADVETRYRRADGSWRYVLTRRVVERDRANRPLAFVGVALDVTERIEHLRHAEELACRLEAASKAAGVGLWSTTIEPAEADWNGQMFALFDRHPAPDPPRFADWLAESVHGDDRERIGRLTRTYLTSGDGPFELEFRFLRKDGSTRWVVMRADVDCSAPGRRRVLGVALDVSERHEALDALREASRRAAFITHQAGIGVWEADAGGEAERWDDRMFELRGLPPGTETPGRAARLAMVHPEDRAHVLDSLTSASLEAPAPHEFRVCLPDGSWRWIASRSAAVFDEQGRAVGRVGANWDVTESKNADAARQQATLAEREIQAKSQFLSRMSHELRTPLNAVLGFTQLLQIEARQSGLDGQLAKLEHIRAAGDHLLSLINDVLDLSGLESGELRLALGPVDLAQLVRQGLPLVQSLAAQSGVSVQTGQAGGMAHADSTRLRQVLINLLSNAIKYNRPGGSVVVDTGGDGEGAWLRVRDTGRGLSKEQIASLFEPFNRFGVEHEGIEGTGIGLTIVKALVDGMGGHIAVTSEAGEGTTFEVRLRPAGALPARAGAAGEPAGPLPAAAPQPLTGAHSGTILYIEDNAVNVLLVEELVKSVGEITIVSEPTGAGGVARAARLRPELVLVDLQLPDIDGFEVLRRLRADPATRSLRCIALSANAMPEDIERGLAAGFAEYWTKPIDFGHFIGELHRLFPCVAAPRAGAAQGRAVGRVA